MAKRTTERSQDGSNELPDCDETLDEDDGSEVHPMLGDESARAKRSRPKDRADRDCHDLPDEPPPGWPD